MHSGEGIHSFLCKQWFLGTFWTHYEQCDNVFKRCLAHTRKQMSSFAKGVQHRGKWQSWDQILPSQYVHLNPTSFSCASDTDKGFLVYIVINQACVARILIFEDEHIKWHSIIFKSKLFIWNFNITFLSNNVSTRKMSNVLVFEIIAKTNSFLISLYDWYSSFMFMFWNCRKSKYFLYLSFGP